MRRPGWSLCPGKYRVPAAGSEVASALPPDRQLLPGLLQTTGLAADAAHPDLQFELAANFLAAIHAHERVGNDLQPLWRDFRPAKGQLRIGPAALIVILF